MTAGNPIAPPALLVVDTFRQAKASGITAMMLVVTVVCALLCLSVRISNDVPLHAGDDPPLFLPTNLPKSDAVKGSISPEAKAILDTDHARAKHDGFDLIRGEVSLAFGAITFPVGRERVDSVRFLETLLGGAIAGTFGLLLALVWTAGFMPTFLETGAISVLIAKPVNRRTLLLGKYLGVIVFMGCQVTLFVALTWLALGVRTGVWDRIYLWSVPLILLQFAVYYGFSVLLAVSTRSTVACVFGSLLFWLISWGMNYGGAMAHGDSESKALSRASRVFAETCYWISPKPIDSALILFNALDASSHFEKPVHFQRVESRASYSPAASIASSLVLASALLGLACFEFRETDY